MENTGTASFRDRPINIDPSGKRKWILARQPKGKWYTRRTIAAWIMMSFLILAPIIKINGNPLMLFDIVHRKFSIFGVQFWAQDTNILALIMAVAVVFIVLFTVVFGRLWCGWACPQTIFLEMVYRRIEYLFDGNHRNIRREQETKKGGARKLLKHVVFILVSVLITNIMLMWFTGPEKLLDIISSPIKEHFLGFSIMIGISLFYYWIYAYFREQVCTMICPYGRMQGVLLDSNSLTVIYDYKRGEPRGGKTEGDCIDCSRCIAVCPTGIDIKNGTQLECINCTACIDECDQVMERIKKPQGLIRFDSVNGVVTGKKKLFGWRSMAYAGVLVVLLLVLAFTIGGRTPTETTILRLPGSLYQEVGTDTIANVYTLKTLNKANRNIEVTYKLLSPASGELQLTNQSDRLNEDEQFESVLLVKLSKDILKNRSTTIIVGIFERGEQLETTQINFIGPEN